MARGAEHAERVLELGAGTGVVTAALAERAGADRLVVFEPNTRLAQALASRFPRSTVHAKFVHQVPEAFSDLPARTLIVSSIPFRSLPDELAAPTVNLLLTTLAADPLRRLVQFTYQPRAPFPVPAGFVWHRREVVLRNLPPAGVWELRAV